MDAPNLLTPARIADAAGLSEHQRAILSHFGRGLKTSDVAREVCRSKPAVKKAIIAIRKRLGLKDLHELTAFAGAWLERASAKT